jgi:hypothetical protein
LGLNLGLDFRFLDLELGSPSKSNPKPNYFGLEPMILTKNNFFTKCQFKPLG